MSERFDLVVVGAGPAGSSAASTAAARGIRTLLLEEHPIVGIPPHCAGILYERNCIRGGLSFPESIVQSMCEEVQVSFGFGNRLSIVGPAFKIVDRTRLDQHLAARAVLAGAELRLSSEAFDLTKSGRCRLVKVRRRREEYDVEADVVVAADGSRCQLMKWAGVNTHMDYLSFMQCEITNVSQPTPAPMKAYISRQLAPGGYGWIIPCGRDSVRAGVGVSAGCAPIRSYLRQLIDHELSDGYSVRRTMGGILPTSGPITRAYDNGVLAVGNAGGFVNPFTGAGIVSSFISGRIAGEVVAEAIGEGDTSADSLHRFQRRVSPVLGTPFRHMIPFVRRYQELDESSLTRIFRLIKRFRVTERFSRTSMFKSAIHAIVTDPDLVMFFMDFVRARSGLTL